MMTYVIFFASQVLKHFNKVCERMLIMSRTTCKLCSRQRKLPTTVWRACPLI